MNRKNRQRKCHSKDYAAVYLQKTPKKSIWVQPE